jgi:hypothetical protein
LNVIKKLKSVGIDFMITDKYELKCIEINNLAGFGSSFPFTPYIVEGLLDLTLYEKTKGKGYFEINSQDKIEK